MSETEQPPEKKYGKGEHPNALKALAENREKTQFGKPEGNKAHYENPNANRPWSIRNSVRYLARQEITLGDKDAFTKLLPKNPTVAQVIAVATLSKASRGDSRAVAYCTDQIDGKVPDKVDSVTITVAQEKLSDSDKKLIDRLINERINGGKDGFVGKNTLGIEGSSQGVGAADDERNGGGTSHENYNGDEPGAGT